jgi:hypothetical protein
MVLIRISRWRSDRRRYVIHAYAPTTRGVTVSRKCYERKTHRRKLRSRCDWRARFYSALRGRYIANPDLTSR